MDGVYTVFSFLFTTHTSCCLLYVSCSEWNPLNLFVKVMTDCLNGIIINILLKTLRKCLSLCEMHAKQKYSKSKISNFHTPSGRESHDGRGYTCVSFHIEWAKERAVSLVECDRTKKKMSFVGLEPHTFCYLSRCLNAVRLEETTNLRLVSEWIITDTNDLP